VKPWEGRNGKEDVLCTRRLDCLLLIIINGKLDRVALPVILESTYATGTSGLYKVNVPKLQKGIGTIFVPMKQE